jgi:hypothetical protein
MCDDRLERQEAGCARVGRAADAHHHRQQNDEKSEDDTMHERLRVMAMGIRALAAVVL